ncbi:MAG: hypothetical protein L6V81_02695 [Clostridium sp.]|nr:MAG: hypothetical protein L6V81_02695 [Clostridium sp.]
MEEVIEKFDTIEEGIKFAINKLNSYYKKDLQQLNKLDQKYASDPKMVSKS